MHPWLADRCSLLDCIAGSAFFGQDSRPSICSVNTDLDTKALAEAREAATQGFRSTLDPTGLNCYPAELAAHATLPLGDVNKENSHPSSPANTGSPLKVSRALPQPVPKRHLVHRSSDGVAHSRSRLNALLSLEDALA